MSKHREQTTVEAPAPAPIGLKSKMLVITEEATGMPDDIFDAIGSLEAPAPAPIAATSNAVLIPPAPEPKPVQRPIGDCLGLMILCPTCSKPTEVTHARGARTATQVVSSKWWVLAKCQGYCGSVLRRTAELVTVMPESVPKPVIKSLGAVVGKTVLCPNELRLPDGDSRPCGREARATWDQDHAHAVVCPDCGVIPYPGATLVEVVG
jgi:hypothetical protein